MKEFLIFKKLSGGLDLKLNAWLKVETIDNSVFVLGEITAPVWNLDGFSTYIVTSDATLLLSDGLSFKKELSLTAINSGFIAVVTKTLDKTPLLYVNYKKAESELSLALERIKNGVYNDEEIATENNFNGANYETERVYNDDNDGGFEDKKSPPKITADSQTLLYENFNSQKGEFYDTVKEKFDQIIYCHARDEELCSALTNGEFCKIFYDEDRFYSVGRIFDNGKVKYLCYAVKGDITSAPKELFKYSKFLPLSPYEKTIGYYVIFQNAKNGEIITS